MGRTDTKEEEKNVDSALFLMTNPVRDQFSHTDLADDEIVALMGRRTLGFFYPEDEYQGKWVQNPYVFDNTYFQELLNDKTRYIKFDDDKSMLADPSLRKYVEMFAEDQELFFETFAKAFVKVSEFGQEDKLLSEV
jgi:catalase (peroxidase I)